VDQTAMPAKATGTTIVARLKRARKIVTHRHQKPCQTTPHRYSQQQSHVMAMGEM
jgi:hypothetical protein